MQLSDIFILTILYNIDAIKSFLEGENKKGLQQDTDGLILLSLPVGWPQNFSEKKSLI